LFNLATNW
jgi:hypothetical protein